MSLKIHMQIERQIHEQIYEYLLLLQQVYAATDEFKELFRKDMFEKCNTAGFQHTIYYILNVFNPGDIKKKVSNWPILDKKMEVQFRKEVLDYINEIRLMYPDASIPRIMPSQLISPGKYKFARMMLSIIQVVVRKVLCEDIEDCSDIIQFPKVTESQHSSVSKHINQLTQAIRKESADEVQAFTNYIMSCQKEAEGIMEGLILVRNNISILEKKLAELKIMWNEENLEEHINQLASDVQLIQDFANTFAIVSELLLYLKGSDCYLKCNNGKQTCLRKHFTDIIHMFNSKINGVVKLSARDLDSKIPVITYIMQNYDDLMNAIPMIKERITDLLCNLENRNLEYIPDSIPTLIVSECTLLDTPEKTKV